MTDAHGHRPRHAHAVRLGAFAQAATVLLDSPSQCGEALFEALHECWLALQNVPGHLPPYRDDPREVVERFEEARTQLGWALREASALTAAAHGERPAGGGTSEPDGGESGEGDRHGDGDGNRDERVGRTDPGASVEGDEAEVRLDSVPKDRVTDSPSHASAVPEEGEGPKPPRTPETSQTSQTSEPPGTSVPSETPETPEISVTPETPESAETPDEQDGLDPANLAKPSVSVRQPRPTEPTFAASELTTPRSTDPQSAPGSPHSSSPGPTAVRTDPLADFAAVLEQLESELRSEQVRYLPQPASPRREDRDGDAAELVGRVWRRVHMALLRLPGDVAAEWRTTAAARAALAGLPVPDEEVADPDVIVLGLPDGLCPAERLPLDFADLPAAARDANPKFHRYLGLPAAEIGDLPPGDPRPAWAVRAAQAERLATLDPELHVALLHDHQPGSLAEQEHRDKYERRLASLLRTAGQGLDEGMAWTRENRLGAAHHLDMVLGGLVHKRPAAPDSWWYQWRTRVSQILVPLAEDANYEVIFRPLEDLHRDFAAEYTIAETVKGVAGSSEPEVQWVVWTALRRKKGANYGPNKHKGRVVVRPAEPTRR
ncbi:hypothetical protein ACIOTI_34600 [Streptomyces sp. NPDC087843]|uniref:hypothetical protein n=1 Tax=Streptomyces sp. NPDC087843 TaxID=3365804 RepID=UPI003828D8AF